MRPRIDPVVGLCGVCANVRRVQGGSSSIFYLCELGLVDRRFRKYPALPVIACPGFRPADLTADT